MRSCKEEDNLLDWIDRLPLNALIIAAILLGLAPFSPEPHLWEKLKMLGAGTLSRPLDIFDLCLHATPAVLLAIRLLRMVSGKRAAP